MKWVEKVGVATLLVAAGLILTESTALASPATCPPTPPDDCSSARDVRGFSAGVFTGEALVDQIWSSPDIGEDPAKWEELKDAVLEVIPDIIAGLPGWPDEYTSYVRCRAQGLIEGSACALIPLDPIPECILDGIDWGVLSAELYCVLSESFGGLDDVVPWFIRPPAGLCADGFQSWCEDVFRYAASDGGDALDPEHATPPGDVTPWPPAGDPLCVDYTQAPFVTVFDDSIFVDCSYEIPPEP